MSRRLLKVVELLEHQAQLRKSYRDVSSVLLRYKNTILNINTDPVPSERNKIFSNNYVNLSDVKVVGFDMDYTLVTYTTDLQYLIFNMARDILVTTFGFPNDLLSCKFDPKFAVRGLSVDLRHGILCKLSHLSRTSSKCSYRGKKRLTNNEVEELYGTARHIPHKDLVYLRPLSDLYSVAEACLIADAIEVFELAQKKTGVVYSPSAIIDDVQSAIRDVHISGTMQSAIIGNLDRYVNYTPHLLDILVQLKKHDKKLFLATNSAYPYVNKVISHALGVQPQPSMLAGNDWRDLFDVIICSAQKPSFYSARRPFRQWNLHSNSPAAIAVNKLEKGNIYVHGSVEALRMATGWKGKEVLYVGDNLRTDLLEARRWHGWLTASIINELEEEIDVHSKSCYNEIQMLRSALRNLISDLQSVMDSMERYSEDYSEAQMSKISADREMLIQAIEAELKEINGELSNLFNPQFGSMFHTDGNLSLFAMDVRRYADLYMSDVGNLKNYSMNHRFYPNQAIHMAHDPMSLSALFHMPLKHKPGDEKAT